MSLPAFVRPLGHGVYVVDTGFHRDDFDAAYLIVQDGHAAFVDTGTNFSVPRLLAALEALGLGRQSVDWVIPTHVHLDHAGGVGALVRELPAARVLVHPRGARHLVDPSALYAGALAVYGQAEMDRNYGALVPVEAARVVSSTDGGSVTLAGRALVTIDTPGHARHHHCIWDEASRGWFTGDTFGLSYREFDGPAGAWILPTTTPVQFEPEALQASIERLLASDPQCMYLTHYGRVTGVPRLAAILTEQLDALVSRSRALQHAPQRTEALREAVLDVHLSSLSAHGCPMPREQAQALLELDVTLNVQGIEAWLDRDANRRSAS
jgi:glyoxylase-like metal-dependent hydrolase (beta-lactamase superfamily II)